MRLTIFIFLTFDSENLQTYQARYLMYQAMHSFCYFQYTPSFLASFFQDSLPICWVQNVKGSRHLWLGSHCHSSSSDKNHIFIFCLLFIFCYWFLFDSPTFFSFCLYVRIGMLWFGFCICLQFPLFHFHVSWKHHRGILDFFYHPYVFLRVFAHISSIITNGMPQFYFNWCFQFIVDFLSPCFAYYQSFISFSFGKQV